MPVMSRITTTHAVADRNSRVASELPRIRASILNSMSRTAEPMTGRRFSDKIMLEQKSKSPAPDQSILIRRRGTAASADSQGRARSG